MSNLTSVVTGPFEFKWRDKTFQVQHITQKIKSEYERKQFTRARDAAVLLKECMSKSEYIQHLKDLNDDFISGEYGLESAKGLKYAQTNKGVLLLCSLLWQTDEETMMQILTDKQEEVKSLLDCIIKESFGSTAQDEEKV